jgi:hypothetical protein
MGVNKRGRTDNCIGGCVNRLSLCSPRARRSARGLGSARQVACAPVKDRLLWRYPIRERVGVIVGVIT